MAVVFTVLFGLMAVIGIFGAFYTIDEGDRGVIVKMGVVSGTAEPGLHFKTPFVTSV